ncbi:DUF4381 domain-containing protein [Alteromonas antoniana]|uniref:DUF4381 domain-containing protein n=1 Tax=Alteromonas antoniana TaxID=2803813 RepID=UPI001C474280|nr:DUF4381 domain-containing protein [Alteromonas antoniana]
MQGVPQQDPLAQLNDIHTPPDVSYWPLDWGWWLVIALAAIILIALIVIAVRKHRHQRARRMAQKELTSITADTENWPARLNAVLKRTAMAYCSQEAVASLYGDKWQQFLKDALPNSTARTATPGLKRLSDLRYQALPPDSNDFTTVHRACSQWLKRARFSHLEEYQHV